MACDRLRRRKRWLSLSKPTRALPSTSSGSDGALAQATDADHLAAQFHAHMNRGVLLLYQQVKALSDLYKLATVLQ